MKLLRYGYPGEEKPAILDDAGQARDLFHYLMDINPQTLADPALLMELHALDPHHLPLVNSSERIGACVGAPGKVIFVGFNSMLHAKEIGSQPLKNNELLIFTKPTSAVCGPFDPVLYTKHMKKLDWEAELGIVIGKKGKYIKPEQASDYIFGYTCINDLSDRYLQWETEDKQFTKGKCFDNAAPIGPYLVTKDEVKDSTQLEVKLWVNDMLRQSFHTKDYIRKDVEVVSYVSQYFTLYPGDIISMGSAPGSAQAWGENAYLKPNDRMVLSITGLGQQEQMVVLEPH